MDQHDLETGVQIGDFRIEQRLGAGGMGIVYQARQVSLDRLVALKILGAALTRESDRARFQREAQAIAKLHHPGIAGVHFVGQDRHVCYMAMEFIDGLPLREVIERLAASRDAGLTIDLTLREIRAAEGEAREVRFDQPTATYHAGGESPADGESESGGGGATAGPALLTPEARRLSASRVYLRRCCEVAHEAALALAHAHERGVVHRDVKPENLLIDRQGRVHLIDFGVARFFEDATLTNTGALVGTPMYMSPEQVTGQLDLDHRTDVYSLGLVLYELLSLGRPIAAPTREGVLRQIVTKAIPPVSWRNPAVPRDLESVLHKATAKDPDDRYQTAAEFAADLRHWLDGKPVAALPYRYRLDRREIKAERPGGIIVLAFAHFLAAAFATSWAALFAAMIVMFSNEKLLGSLAARGALPHLPRGEAISGLAYSLAVSLSIATYSLWIGFGLLAANRWARRASLAMFSVLAAWCLYGMATVGTIFGPRGVGFGFRAVLLALAASTLAYLLRRSTRDWFRLAERLRAEHGPPREGDAKSDTPGGDKGDIRQY